MHRLLLAAAVLFGALAGCSQDSDPGTGQATSLDKSSAFSPARLAQPGHRSAVASLPDRGELLAYKGDATPVKRGATRWYPVNLSEEHALRAVATGELRVSTPEGRPLQFKYQRHVEHKNGNWTWVGKMDGAESGREAVLTFGEKAVYGSIPYDDAEPLRLAMSAGRTWLVETDPVLAAANAGTSPAEPDFLIPGVSARTPGASLMAAAGTRTAPPFAFSHTQGHATVDIALGYTAGFADSVGGQSQAVTRLTFLVDLANQAYAASGVDGQLRLVRSVMVNYPDATNNRNALFELTGVNCTAGTGANLPGGTFDCNFVGQPAALAPLIQAREAYGADVVGLVRRYENPESASCGIGWLLGGGQQEITSADGAYAMSVISDTSPEGSCRDDTLAHEVGHNMGLQHDRQTAQGTDDSNNDGNLLDPDEYGRYPYSFGHRTGDFYTIMSVRRAGQTGYLVFSNPNLTSCGGQACGVAEEADNARALNLTMPVIAGFRATVVPQGLVPDDFNGDGVSDLLWRHTVDGRNVIWLGANAGTSQTVAQVPNQAWRVVGKGDFNGDGTTDLFWRNSQDGSNSIWLSGDLATIQPVTTVNDQDWQVAGIGDFNGDGRSDVLWRNSRDGSNTIWLSGMSSTTQAVASVPGQAWIISGVGDFNGDGNSDVFWRNINDGQNTIWLSANWTTSQAVATVGVQSWQVAATGDFNGDGTWDLLWRNSADGSNAIWRGGDLNAGQALAAVPTSWAVAATGDYNGDGTSDILWRNSINGQNSLWLSANIGRSSTVPTVSDLGWTIVK